MISEELKQRIERTQKLNREAVKGVREQGEMLNRAAERSVIVVDRAVRQLRRELNR